MTEEQIQQLISAGSFLEDSTKPELNETHISWVLLTERFVYKIKKPIQYSFLDFSTLEKRKYYCEREIELNNRLTDNIYLDVQPVRENAGHFAIGKKDGKIIDYAVRMNKLDSDKQMNKLLKDDKVSATDIHNLAEKIAAFHQNTKVIDDKDFMDIKAKFDDLQKEKDYLREHLNKESLKIISHAIKVSDTFMENHKEQLAARMKAGFYRDGHGDLHSRNIFLLPEPQPFDCIEFNDDFRQIDVLNEIAFLCMDLDAFGKQDLAEIFFDQYNKFFPAVKNETDKQLFIYYKAYRANIRAKVNSLRASSAAGEAEKKKALVETEKYLQLMGNYLKKLKMN